MKFFILIPVFSFLFCSAKAQSSVLTEFTLTGHIIGRDTGDIKISYRDKNQVWIDDTAKIKNGKFFFSGAILEPTYASIAGYTKSKSVSDPNWTSIFLEPKNMIITLTEGDFANAKVEGSYSQTLLNELKLLKAPIEESSKSLREAYSAAKQAYAKGDTSKFISNRLKSLQIKLMPFQENLKNLDLAFIKKHNNEYISSYLLNFYADKITKDSLSFYYNILSPSVRNNSYGTEIFQALMPAKKQVALAGSIAPEILAKDINGKEISLNSLKNKNFVLLDFWASWCIPCRRMNPTLKKIYGLYANKGLKIISLSFDYDQTAWKNAIAKDGLNNWQHVLVGINGKTADNIRNNYDVITVPAYFLINKSGVVIGRYNVIDESISTGLVEQLNKIL